MPCIVHQHVDGSKGCNAGGDGLADAVGIGDVERQQFQSLRRRREHGRIGSAHRGEDIPATIEKQLGHRLPVTR